MSTKITAATSVIVAAALLILAVPRTISALAMAPAAPVLRKLQYFHPIEDGDLHTLVDFQKRGLVWKDDGRTWTDLGLAQLLTAERLASEDPNYRPLIETAIASIRNGLALEPANPYPWTRLAYGEALLRGWSPLALASLRMAVLTAPYEPRLSLARLRLLFLAWPALGEPDRLLVLQQVRFTWKDNPQELVKLAVTMDKINVVRAALLRSPEELKKFEQRLDKAT
jgi:hypothetical protein